MIDIHNHILPNVDDGSKSTEESLAMLKTAIDQGITDVVSTVHFQHPKMEKMNTDYGSLEKKIQLLQNKIGDKIKIHLGAEVYFLPNLLDVKKHNFTVFNHGKYMLIEFQSYYNHPNYEFELQKLKISGTTPIIAHPERSLIFRKDINKLIKLIEIGCLLQINGGSLLGFFGKKCQAFTKKILCRDMVHFIASDSHNIRSRNFCLNEAYSCAFKLIGSKATALVYDNPKKVLSGQDIHRLSVKEENILKQFLNKYLS